jgi:hypothetical protein
MCKYTVFREKSCQLSARCVKLASHLAIEISTVRHQYYPTGDAGTNDGRHDGTLRALADPTAMIEHAVDASSTAPTTRAQNK